MENQSETKESKASSTAIGSTEKLLATLMNTVTTINDRLSVLDVRLSKMEAKAKTELATPVAKAPVSTQVEQFSAATPPAILEAVYSVLDKRFAVSTKENQKGFSYQLVIVPPETLRESPEDRRVKVINYSEGVEGAKNFAKVVRDFCLAWATRNGVSYDKGL